MKKLIIVLIVAVLGYFAYTKLWSGEATVEAPKTDSIQTVDTSVKATVVVADTAKKDTTKK